MKFDSGTKIRSFFNVDAINRWREFQVFSQIKENGFLFNFYLNSSSPQVFYRFNILPRHFLPADSCTAAGLAHYPYNKNRLRRWNWRKKGQSASSPTYRPIIGISDYNGDIFSIIWRREIDFCSLYITVLLSAIALLYLSSVSKNIVARIWRRWREGGKEGVASSDFHQIIQFDNIPRCI